MIAAASMLGAGVALAMFSERGPQNNVKVQSKTDGKTYNVQNLSDKQVAAEKLANIRKNLDRLVEYYKSDPNTSSDPRIRVFLDRYNPENILENDIKSSTTSYSENKGQQIVICLRDKRKPYDFVETNTVMFVVIHEMAHLMTTTTGHTPEFWANFHRMLLDAAKVGIYSPVNYARHPTAYCGMTITDSII